MIQLQKWGKVRTRVTFYKLTSEFAFTHADYQMRPKSLHGLYNQGRNSTMLLRWLMPQLSSKSIAYGTIGRLTNLVRWLFMQATCYSRYMQAISCKQTMESKHKDQSNIWGLVSFCTCTVHTGWTWYFDMRIKRSLELWDESEVSIEHQQNEQLPVLMPAQSCAYTKHDG